MLTEYKTKREHYWTDEKSRLQGEFKEWWHNGQLWMHGYYVDDNLDGECKVWHKNGQLGKHCYHMAGNHHGELKRWDENGNLIQHEIFVNGELLNINTTTLTDKDKFELSLRHNIKWL